jgi:alpha-L-fucosidase
MVKEFKTALVSAGLLLAPLVPSLMAAADSPDPYANETPAQRDARMSWWRQARFGMFIHWGVYSVPAGTYNDRRVPGLGEWIMNDAKIPMAVYQAFAKDYNPVKYDADQWVQLAKEAGMKYIVITAKHHDGFANFDTKASDWNIVKATPYGQDVLKPLAAACRKYGVKLGFYYSQAQDWNNGGAACNGKWDPAQAHDMDDYIDKVALPQVRELLSNYGEFPAMLWWDTSCDMNRERAGKLLEVLKLKPGIIYNDRVGGDFRGDTETPEQTIPATGFRGRDWETCMTMNNTWGFKSYDNQWKSTQTIIRNLVDIASKGGNYLLNVGPTSEGLIPGPSVERLKAVGAWMKVNGDAIYATTASPFKSLAWGRCTKVISGDETTLYLHVFNWPDDGRLVVPGLKNLATSAQLLAGGAALSFTNVADGVEVRVPATAPDPISSTVVLKIKGAPDIAVKPITQASDGTVRLSGSEAELRGNLQYEVGGGKDDIGYWTNPADTASWTFQVDHPGKFTLVADIAAEQSARFEVWGAGQTLQGASPATRSYTTFSRTNLTGTLEIASPGKVTLTVQPVAPGWRPMNLRSLRLVPEGQ